jgi:hypothetical protein
MMGEKDFRWRRFPKVEKLFLNWIDEFKRGNAVFRELDSRLYTLTNSKIIDWIDHILLPDSTQTAKEIEGLGFKKHSDEKGRAYRHPGVLLPSIVLSGDSSSQKAGIAIRVERISDFLQVNGFHFDIEGLPFSPLRRALLSIENDLAMFAVERRGTGRFEPTYPDDGYLGNYFKAVENWKNIPRDIYDEEKAFSVIIKTAQEMISTLGQDVAAHIACECERDYWLSRNYAARAQKSRQDALGLGWANHDHHTFRSSRLHFSRLVRLFSLLGFHARERYYAGKEAGWGAQIMENSNAGLVLFLDVDLDAEEVDIDFTTKPLKERDKLGTVGLWCAMHGDSILKGGMHHLAANFAFERLIEDSSRYGISFMAPFSDFKYLKQAFSTAETWRVDHKRVEKLLVGKMITTKQADKFIREGAIGSHLENIERREGYKGFNKKNVSAIIKKTDPRAKNR